MGKTNTTKKAKEPATATVPVVIATPVPIHPSTTTATLPGGGWQRHRESAVPVVVATPIHTVAQEEAEPVEKYYHRRATYILCVLGLLMEAAAFMYLIWYGLARTPYGLSDVAFGAIALATSIVVSLLGAVGVGCTQVWLLALLVLGDLCAFGLTPFAVGWLLRDFWPLYVVIPVVLVLEGFLVGRIVATRRLVREIRKGRREQGGEAVTGGCCRGGGDV